MPTIQELEEFDRLKTKVLKYIMYKKRTEHEIRRKFSNVDNQEMLEDVIENLKEIGYINDENYINRAVAEFMNLNNLSLKFHCHAYLPALAFHHILNIFQIFLLYLL